VGGWKLEFGTPLFTITEGPAIDPQLVRKYYYKTTNKKDLRRIQCLTWTMPETWKLGARCCRQEEVRKG
jgi:hypothetical protein